MVHKHQKRSAAYSLLVSLHIKPSYSKEIKNMTAKEIWKSHPSFQQYKLDKFKEYNKIMMALTNKRRGLIANREEMYMRDMLLIPKRTRTNINLPFCNDHPASDLLENDERSGIKKNNVTKRLVGFKIGVFTRKDTNSLQLPVGSISATKRHRRRRWKEPKDGRSMAPESV